MLAPLAIALFILAIPSLAFAECGTGYHLNSVPLCQSIPTCSSTSATTNQMGILKPCSPNVVTANQVSAAALTGIGITDANAAVAAAPLEVMVKAPGSLNVEVWTHGNMAVRLSKGSGDIFTGILNLSSEPAGPLKVMYHAWDVAAGGTPTVHLQGQYALFVAGTRPSIPTPAPASGLTLAFSDHFTSLSSTPCKPGTGTWPSCTNPSASDGFKWYENQYNGLDYGDCAFEHTDGSHNPFTILPSGGLRIRNQYDGSYTDPYGFGRHQYCGQLSSAFKDGSNSNTVVGDGYYDARVLVPNAACGSSGNNSCSGGTWPAFWMLTVGSPNSSNIELDMMEMYGSSPDYLQQYTHVYNGAFYPNGTGAGSSGYDGDHTWDWHTVGMKVTGSGTATGQICTYFDEVQQNCAGTGSMPQFASPNQTAVPKFAIMLNLASGGGWHEAAPPAGNYDYFVDWVGVWH